MKTTLSRGATRKLFPFSSTHRPPLLRAGLLQEGRRHIQLQGRSSTNAPRLPSGRPTHRPAGFHPARPPLIRELRPRSGRGSPPAGSSRVRAAPARRDAAPGELLPARRKRSRARHAKPRRATRCTKRCRAVPSTQSRAAPAPTAAGAPAPHGAGAGQAMPHRCGRGPWALTRPPPSAEALGLRARCRPKTRRCRGPAPRPSLSIASPGAARGNRNRETPGPGLASRADVGGAPRGGTEARTGGAACGEPSAARLVCATARFSWAPHTGKEIDKQMINAS